MSTVKREADFAVEALAGLASKENFSKVELRKTDSSSLPASLALRQNPFSDLMLLHIKGELIQCTDSLGSPLTHTQCLVTFKVKSFDAPVNNCRSITIVVDWALGVSCLSIYPVN